MIETRYTKYKPHGAYLQLSNDRFILDVDDESGVVKGLYFKDDFNDANFAGNEENQRVDVNWRGHYVPDMHHRAPLRAWTGDIILMAREAEASGWTRMNTMLSDDVRKLTCDDHSITTIFDGDSQYDGGLKGIRIKRVFRLHRDRVQWTFSLENTGAKPLTIGELGIPVIFNTNTTIGDARTGFNHRSVDNEEYLSENRVTSHYFVSGHSSCITAVRFAGIGDVLTLLPVGNTFLEAVSENVFHLYSKAIMKQEWYNGHRELILAPGERRSFSFVICRSKSTQDVNEKLYEYGCLDVKVLPGMVLPTDGQARLLLRSKKPIHSLEGGPGISTEKTGELGSRHVYTVRVSEEGEQKVTVHYGDGEWANLPFYGTRPLEELIDARGKFITEHQRVTDPDDKCRYSFRSWDNDIGAIVDGSNAPCGIMDLGGSDDRNFAPPLYLSEKNVYYPAENEIKILDDFVEKFLYGVLQDRETFEVLNCIYDSDETYEILKGTEEFRSIAGFLITDENGRETTWRSWKYPWRIYNYPHAFKVHYNMYRLAKRYGSMVSRKANEYLYFAYRTAMAMYSDSTYANTLQFRGFQDHATGSLYRSHAPQGAWLLGDILEALSAEGMSEEFKTLKDTIVDVSKHFTREKYTASAEYMGAGASPCSSGLYLYAQVVGDERLKKTVVDSILAGKDSFPAWFSYGVFNRFVGSYMTSHMSYPLLDQYMQTSDEHLLHLAYGGILAVWACVEPSGHGYNTREWRFNPPEKGHPGYHYYANGCQSGELGVGLHRDFSLLISCVVQDADFGLTGLGCDVSELAEQYVVKPWSGFGFRVYIHETGLMLESESFKMREIRIAKDGTAIEIDPAESQEEHPAASITVKGMAAGEYRVVAGTEETTIACDAEGQVQLQCGIQPVRMEKLRA